MDNYYYTLQYRDGNTLVTHRFSAELDIWELADHLRDFLCACSWQEKLVADILKLGDEE